MTVDEQELVSSPGALTRPSQVHTSLFVVCMQLVYLRWRISHLLGLFYLFCLLQRFHGTDCFKSGVEMHLIELRSSVGSRVMAPAIPRAE